MESKEKYLSLVACKMKDTDAEEELIEAFKVCDLHGNSVITAAEVGVANTNSGAELTDEDVDEMTRKVDGDEQRITRRHKDEDGRVMSSRWNEHASHCNHGVQGGVLALGGPQEGVRQAEEDLNQTTQGPISLRFPFFF